MVGQRPFGEDPPGFYQGTSAQLAELVALT